MIDPIALGLETFRVAGNEVQVLCPFHADHTPSASFNVKKGLFYCYTCGLGTSAKKIANELGGEVISLKDTSFLKFIKDEKEWRPLLYAPRAIDHPYLQQRGVSNGQVDRYDIKELSDGVGFPLWNWDGTILGLQKRKTGGRGRTSRYILYGEKPAIWPMAAVFLDLKRPLLVEGVFSVLLLEKFGARAFAVLSSQITIRTIRVLNGRYPRVWFDNDYAGYVGAAKLILSAGALVLVGAGTPPDEISSLEHFQDIKKAGHFTSSLEELAELSGDTARFWKHIKLWRGKHNSSKHSRR